MIELTVANSYLREKQLENEISKRRNEFFGNLTICCFF